MRKFLSSLIALGAVYIIPSDFDALRQKTDTVYEFVFYRMCTYQNQSGENVLICSGIPQAVFAHATPYSHLRDVQNVQISMNLRGIDRIVFCQNYETGQGCESFTLEDYTSLRLEIVPYDQLSTYQIQKPNCSNGQDTVVFLTYSNCSLNTAFQDNGTHWTVNSICFPTNMNIPILVFCSTWSK